MYRFLLYILIFLIIYLSFFFFCMFFYCFFFFLFFFYLFFFSLFFFFFFQAEDGIRDRDETGVQTCALPIYLSAAGDDPLHVFRLERLELRDHRLERAAGELVNRRRGLLLAQQRLRRHHHQRLPERPQRSEVRRVGKSVVRWGGGTGMDAEGW